MIKTRSRHEKCEPSAIFLKNLFRLLIFRPVKCLINEPRNNEGYKIDFADL